MKRTHRELIRVGVLCLVVTLAWSCKPGSTPAVSDAFITASVSAGTSAGLNLTIKDQAKRKVIAAYLNNYAGALRSIVGNPSPEELTKQLMAFIPADVSSQYPELGSFAVPLIVSFYQWAEAKYGADTATAQKILGDVASGIETGSTCCLK